MAEIKAFLSYARKNNRTKRVAGFKENLESLVGELSGLDFAIFMDDQIEVGELWEKRILKELDEATVLIAVMTPTFFQRPWCMDEVKLFLDRHEAVGREPALLPIYWIEAPEVEDPDSLGMHPLAARIKKHQYDDWRSLFARPLSHDDVWEKLNELAKKVHNSIKRAHSIPAPSAPAPTVPAPVAPTSKPTVRARAKARIARLEIENAPTNATVTVNGDVLTESWFEVELADGELTREIEVVVATLGYEVMEWDVIVVAGETAKIDAALTKIPVAVVKPRLMTPPAPKIFTPPLTLAEYKAQMVTIPAGEFLRGDDDMDDATPQTKIYLSEYKIGVVPVTVGMYEEFSQATGYSIPESPDFNEEWAKKDHPMVNVSWQNAATFASWAGLSLPSEAQWEKAARGTDGRKYSWGEDWKPELLHWWENKDKYGGGTAPVGSYLDGESPYHVLDMAGNVWEWCEDWYDEDGYFKVMQNNPLGPPGGTGYVLRGGSWGNSDMTHFRCIFRGWDKPGIGSNDGGFRLVSGR